MTDRLGQLVCFDGSTREAVDPHLDWHDVEKGKHKGCGNPVAIEADYFSTHDIETQQQICDAGVKWKFLPPSQVEGAFRVKRLPRPWAEGEVLRMINRASR